MQKNSFYVSYNQRKGADIIKHDFYSKRKELDAQFISPEWIDESGVDTTTLEKMIFELEAKEKNSSKALIKARTFELICSNAKIAVDKEDIFQDKIVGRKLMVDQRGRWEKEIIDRYLFEEREEMKTAWKEFGAYRGFGDYGHISPNTRLLMSVGIPGLLCRVETAAIRADLTQKQSEFYESCRIVLGAMIKVAERLSNAIRPYNAENADALLNISKKAPESSYEAMQLLVLYFFLHEYIAGARVRTLGRLDVLLYPFFKKDVESGKYTKEEIEDMLRYFLNKFWSAKVPFDLPFCIGGCDENGNSVVNEMSYLIVNIYNELDIYSPKIHVRVCEDTPCDFIKLILSYIRAGHSSFVFVNDSVAVKALENVEIEKNDVWDYVPIGCYEPAVWGKEIGCTGNGGVNIAKAIELAFTNGIDNGSGKSCGLRTGKIGMEIKTFDEFVIAVKKQIEYMLLRAKKYVVSIEKHYAEIYPDAILSSQYDNSVEIGIDVYEGGAKYNNSSLYFYGIATVVDSLCVIKRFVFDEKIISLCELGEMLKNNWSENEFLRNRALSLKEKYGNGDAFADSLAVEMSDYCASLVNNKPNGRGGVFKAALFTIDECFYLGKRTMATPDGRMTGESLSKNLCATVGMDRKGITALINSVTMIDHSKFPNGSVLDVVLHPSAVAGEDGLDAFYGLLITYMKKGGFAMHGNVFDAKTLRAAQIEPEKYKNMQVRVCGWNAYFVDLSVEEQNAFIKQAERKLLND